MARGDTTQIPNDKALYPRCTRSLIRCCRSSPTWGTEHIGATICAAWGAKRYLTGAMLPVSGTDTYVGVRKGIYGDEH